MVKILKFQKGRVSSDPTELYGAMLIPLQGKMFLIITSCSLHHI